MTNSMSQGDEEQNAADASELSPRPAHTPLPWHVESEDGHARIIDGSGRVVWVDRNHAQLAFIVRAVNAHDALVAACQSAAIAPYSSEATQVKLIAALRLAEANVPERETETSAKR